VQRIAAVLGAILLGGQLLVQPVAAAEVRAEAGHIRTQTERTPESPRNPGLPHHGNVLTAGPLGDVKVDLVSAWWQGNERHSKFKIENVGTGTSFDVKIWKQTRVDRLDPIDDDHFESSTQLGDIPAGAFTYITMICSPKPGWVCDLNRMKALTEGSDTNPANNDAEDNV